MSSVEKINCEICEKQYNSRYTLNRHMRIAHEKPYDLICEFCHRKFARPDTLKFHTAHSHGAELNINTSDKSFDCPICSVCLTREDFSDHLLKQHDLVLKSYVKEFDGLNEFKKWKEDFEETTKSRYVKPYGGKRSADGSMVHFYNCHRSDYYYKRGKDKRQTEIAGSSKINCYCPAEIKAKETPDGKITAYITETHVGHETDSAPYRPKSSLKTRQDPKNVASQFDSNPETIKKSKVSPKIIDLRKKHKKALEQGLLVIKIIAAQHEGMVDQWCVRSNCGTIMYDVVPDNSDCTCKVFCNVCKFCIHAFKCSCPDYMVSLNMCEHIHTVGIEILKDSVENENLPDIDSFLTDSNDSFLIEDNEGEGIRKEGEIDVVFNVPKSDQENLKLVERIKAIKQCCERIGNNISQNEEIVTYLEKTLFPIERVKLAMENSLQGKPSKQKQDRSKIRKMKGQKRFSSAKKRADKEAQESEETLRLALALLRDSP